MRHVGSIRLLSINHKVISRVKYVAEKIVMGMVMGENLMGMGWGKFNGDGVGMGLIFTVLLSSGVHHTRTV